MKTWNFIDKFTWGEGPWQTEPDKAQWVDEQSKLDCLIVRNPMGSLCGYVGIKEGHPLYNINYNDIYEHYDIDISIHGGLTYSRFCQEYNKEYGICHITDTPEDRVYWFGFDCAHFNDTSPNSLLSDRNIKNYKNFEYVQNQCKHLAQQLKVMESLDANISNDAKSGLI